MKRCHLFLTALVLALALSVGVNAALFERGTRYYLELNATRLDPLDIRAFPAAPPPDAARPLVVFLGDSRAQDWPAPALDGLAFLNRGIGAQTCAQVAGRFDAHIAPLQPDVLVLQVGINDLKTIPLFPDQSQTIAAGSAACIRQLVGQARAVGAAVVLTTVFPVGAPPLERRLFWSDDIAQAVTDVNAQLRALADDSLIVLDAYNLLADDDGLLRPEYSQDELHLNAAGYAVLNEALANLLLSALGGDMA